MKFDVSNIDYDDQQAWSLICEGKTKGVFQLESNLGKSWAKRVKPRNIEELAALVALIRPGCLKAIVDGKSMTQHYVDRKDGEEEVTYIHESLKPMLNKTQGVLVYQEQSMQIAQKLAGFNLQEADDLRKAIGKKNADLMAQVKKNFIKGAATTKIVDKETAEEIFSWIEKSSRYSFNKSHAVSYAICGYWSAYAKAHHPLEFYCSYLQYSHGKMEPQEEVRQLIRDAKSLDIFVHPPSLRELNEKTKIIDDKIHFGLRDIKNVGDRYLNQLRDKLPEVEKLMGKPIEEWSWYEFLTCFSAKLSKALVVAMISVGMLGHTGEKRERMKYEFDTLRKLSPKELEWVEQNYSNYNDLLDLLTAVAPTKKEGGATHTAKRSEAVVDLARTLKDPPHSLEDDPQTIMREEDNYLGVSITYSKIEASDTSLADTTCKQVIDGKRGKVKLAVNVNEVKRWITKQEKEMAFLVVEDTTGELDNLAIFSEKWENYKNILYQGNNVLLSCNSTKDKKKDGLIVNEALEI